MDNTPQSFLKNSIVSLFNLYSFIQPKLNQFKDLSTGIPFKQIINFIQDKQQTFDSEDINWAMSLKLLNETLDYLESNFKMRRQSIDILQICKNQDEISILELVNWIFYAMYKSPHSQLLFEPMLSMPEHEQISIANVIQNIVNVCENPHKQEENQSQQKDQQDLAISQDFLRKLEELEHDNSLQKQKIKQLEKEIEENSKQFKLKEEIFEKDIHELEQIIAKKDESLNAILDKYQASSLDELQTQIQMRDQEIYNLQDSIQEMSQGMKYAKESSEDILKSLRNDLETQKKKNQLIPKLERQMESLKIQLNDLKEYERKAKELEKEKIQLKNINEDNVQKLKALQDRYSQSKTEQKQVQQRLAILEFDLQKQRSETMSYMRQLAMKEQEIFQLQQEISDLENALDRFKHQNEESQILMDKSSQIFTEGEERKTNHLGGILSPKRNLGHELSEVMKRSSFQWDQVYNNSGIELQSQKTEEREDVHVRQLSDMKVLDELEEVQSNDDEEGKNKISIDRKKTEGNQQQEEEQDLVSFWKNKCQDLLSQIYEKDERYLEQNENVKHLEAKLEKFFKEQTKYEKDLEQAKEYLQKQMQEVEEKNILIKNQKEQIQQLLQDKSDLQLNLTNKSNDLQIFAGKLSKYEEQHVERQKRKQERQIKSKVQSTQLLEKQLKITKKTYEEALIGKDQEIGLISSLLFDIIKKQDKKDLQKLLESNITLPIGIQSQQIV